MPNNEFEFPSVIKKAVNGLDNDVRWKIIESIVNKGDMSYSRLMSELRVDNKGILNFHLKNLSKSALIERYEDLSNRSGDRSFYTIGEIGKEIINGLMTALIPHKNKIIYFDYETSAIKDWDVHSGVPVESDSSYAVLENRPEIASEIATN